MIKLVQSRRRALLIVQRDFMTVHVGVRRVIFFYWYKLVQAGCSVTLATPLDGKLLLAESVSFDEVADRSHGEVTPVAPTWSSSQGGDPRPPQAGDRAPGPIVSWTTESVLAADYDISIVTVPWLYEAGLPRQRYTAGIIYDLIPNLVSCGALTYDTSLNVYDFAREHDRGNYFFFEHCEAILPISDSTRRDLIEFYGLSDETTLIKVVPFLDEVVRERRPGGGHKDRSNGRFNIILVNVLDPRKNFRGIAAALTRLQRLSDVSVTVVGSERAMQPGTAMALFKQLTATGVDVTWYSNAGDAQLNDLYQKSDLLVFPSFYEGLGLPILEAQAHGVPAISSGISSCGEINMNQNLCVDALDPDQLVAAIDDVIAGTRPIITGRSLKDQLAGSLREWNRVPFLT